MESSEERWEPSKITKGIAIHGICEKRTRGGGNNTKTSKGYLKNIVEMLRILRDKTKNS